MVPLLVRAGGEAGVVEGARDRVGIAAIELDLDPEGLVRIPDNVLALVLRRLRRVRHLEQLSVKVVVGAERPLALGNLLTLEAKELVPHRLGLGGLAVKPLALLLVAIDGTAVEVGPGRCPDRRIVIQQVVRDRGGHLRCREGQAGGGEAGGSGQRLREQGRDRRGDGGRAATLRSTAALARHA